MLDIIAHAGLMLWHGIAFVIWHGLALATQPATLIASTGPAIINLNTKILRGQLLPPDRSGANTPADPLQNLLRNEWAMALKNWIVQIFVVIIASVALLIETASTVVRAAMRASTFDRFVQSTQDDFWVGIACCALIITIIYSCKAIFKYAGTREAVQLYLPPPGTPDGADFTKPPFRSPLTKARILITISGGLVYVASRSLGVG